MIRVYFKMNAKDTPETRAAEDGLQISCVPAFSRLKRSLLYQGVTTICTLMQGNFQPAIYGSPCRCCRRCPLQRLTNCPCFEENLPQRNISTSV
ncbi:hypothetical protein Naga_100546g3 [Nannochloropsis gaditana]|uniref:Uncharacterized protein n=1 Tax=Nannochloropsis gaditana TaxID=72520 RepID=W7TZ36_9STRA|nr:hypothetical protein Naga_100546g3 [Nannochloropsis gaditana]